MPPRRNRAKRAVPPPVAKAEAAAPRIAPRGLGWLVGFFQRLGPVRSILLAAIAALGITGVLTHEWWRDECNPYLVARSAHSVPELLATMGFNGHPHLFYILCYFITCISESPLFMSMVTLTFGLVAIALFFAGSPFSIPQKLLYGLGFFPLYQYSVFCRSYALLMLCAAAYAYIRHVYPERIATRLLALAVLAQVHLIAIMMAVILLFFELLERGWQRSRAEWAGALAAVASIVAAMWQLIPPGRNDPSVHGSIQYVLLGIGNGFVPMLTEQVVPIARQRLGWALCGVSAAVLVSRAGWRALLCYLLMTASLVLMFLKVYPGYRWHHGFYYFDFIFCIWVWGPKVNDSWVKYYVTALLALHAGLGLYAMKLDFSRPYSNGKAMAERIRAEHLESYPLVVVDEGSAGYGAYNWSTDEGQSIIAYLPQKPLYNPASGRFEDFYSQYADHYYQRTHRVTNLEAALRTLAEERHSETVVVAMIEHQPHMPRPITLQRIASFQRPLDFGEHFALFRFDAQRSP